MGARPVSGANARAATTSADPDAFQGALVVVAAAAGLVWALAHGSSEVAPDAPALTRPPDTFKPWR